MFLKSIFAFGALVSLCSCSTPQGYYKFEAFDASGQSINLPMNVTTDGKGIYTVINALCSRYRGAKLVIREVKTNEELAGESPRQCR